MEEFFYFRRSLPETFDLNAFVVFANCKLIGNRTSCRLIMSVSILVSDKLDSRFAVVQLNYSYEYRPTWTQLGPITIK